MVLGCRRRGRGWPEDLSGVYRCLFFTCVCGHPLRCGGRLSQQCGALALGWTAWAERLVLVGPGSQ